MGCKGLSLRTFAILSCKLQKAVIHWSCCRRKQQRQRPLTHAISALPNTLVGGIFGKVSTGIAVASGFFSSVLSTPSVLRTTAGAASGAARKKTATRYDLRLGGSSRIIRAAGRIIKPRVDGENPSHDDPALQGWNLPLLLTSRGVGGLWVEIIHPAKSGRFIEATKIAINQGKP